MLCCMTLRYKQRIQQLDQSLGNLRNTNYHEMLLQELRQEEMARHGIDATVDTDFYGITRLTLCIPPNYADLLYCISDLLASSAELAEIYSRKRPSFVHSEVKRIERMALNVWKRSQSIKLAAQASGMRPVEVKRLILRVNNYHARKHKEARNNRIKYLVNKEKLSLRKVGAMFNLNHNTIRKIAAG